MSLLYQLFLQQRSWASPVIIVRQYFYELLKGGAKTGSKHWRWQVREQGSMLALLWCLGFQGLWVLSAIWGLLPEIPPSEPHPLIIITIKIDRQHLWRSSRSTKCLFYGVPHLSSPQMLRDVRWLGCTHLAIKMHHLWKGHRAGCFQVPFMLWCGERGSLQHWWLCVCPLFTVGSQHLARCLTHGQTQEMFIERVNICI